MSGKECVLLLQATNTTALHTQTAVGMCTETEEHRQSAVGMCTGTEEHRQSAVGMNTGTEAKEHRR